jgi:VCBS repeat-containing protein
LVSVTITGSNDAAVITGTSSGAVVEAGGVANATPGTPTATGDLQASDVDNATDAFQAVAAGATTSNHYGTFGVTAAGVWTYTLDNTNAAVQALNTGSPALSDTFTVLSQDGTPQVVTIAITGSNDAAVITGTSSGAVVEAGGTPGTPSATGDLLASDVDNATDAFQPVAAGAATANSYGTYGVTAAGVWTYTLDNANATVQALNTGSPALSDSFTVLSADGTPRVVTITISGSNDGPVAVTDNVITNVTNGTNFVVPEWALLANDVDPDGGGALDISSVGGAVGLTATHTPGSGSNGSVTLNDPAPAGGSFTYQATDGATIGASGTVNVTQDIAGTLDGTAGKDIIVSANGGATLVGNAGNDILLGGGGNDTYRFGLNDGSDLIRDSGGGGDKIEIVTTGPGDATILSTLNFERVGTDLVIDVGSTQITVDDHYVSGFQVESIQFSPGGTVYGYALSNGAYDLSTDASTPLSEGGGSDVIASSSGTETLSGGGGNDLLFGNGGADTINGEAGADLLVGGLGADTLSGGADNDVMVGGLDNDTFVFAAGESSLTIGGSGNAGTISGFDTVRDYAVITAGAAADRIDTVGNPDVVANTAGTNGVDSSLTIGGQTVKSHSISNGLITFDDANTFGGALVIDSMEDVAAVVQYLQAQDLGGAGATVGFTANIGGSAHTYLYTQGTSGGTNASDVLVDLFGVTAAGVTESAPGHDGYVFIL